MEEIQRNLINAFPTWAIIAGSVVLTSVAIIIMFVAIRRYMPLRLRQSEDFFTTVIGVTSAIYGFFLGFVVVVLWQALDTATMITTQEANRLALTVWSSQVFPEDVRLDVEDGVSTYVNLLIKEEWPAMRDGHSSDAAFFALQDLYMRLKRHPPQNELERIYFREMLDNVNHVVQKRRERLRAMESNLTGPLRFILVAGMFLIAFLLSLIETSNPFVQLGAILIVCGVIAFNLGIAVILDYPFSGGIAVDYMPFVEGVLRKFVDPAYIIQRGY